MCIDHRILAIGILQIYSVNSMQITSQLNTCNLKDELSGFVTQPKSERGSPDGWAQTLICVVWMEIIRTL